MADTKSSHQKTFIAYEGDCLVGTLTIGFDSGTGLLVEQLFEDEIKLYRASGSHVCEFTKLAVETDHPSKRLLPVLFHAAYAYAYMVKGMKTLCIEVNPRHVKYYEKMLGFKKVSGERYNSRVQAPAVLLALDLAFASEQIGTLGGRPNLKLIERSAYPQFLSKEEELILLDRLCDGESELIKISDTEAIYPTRAHIAQAGVGPGIRFKSGRHTTVSTIV